jgi:hypothetical protein
MKTNYKKAARSSWLMLSIMLLASCGGGGNSNNAVTPIPTPIPVGVKWNLTQYPAGFNRAGGGQVMAIVKDASNKYIAKAVITSLLNGVQYFDGISWKQLIPESLNYGQISGLFADFNSNSPQVLVAINGGSIEYANGKSNNDGTPAWAELHKDTGRVITVFNPQFSHDGSQPRFVAQFDDGSSDIRYFDGSNLLSLNPSATLKTNSIIANYLNESVQVLAVSTANFALYYSNGVWTTLADSGGSGISLAAAQINSIAPPQMVAQLYDNTIKYYDGTKWILIHDNSIVGISELQLAVNADASIDVVGVSGNTMLVYAHVLPSTTTVDLGAWHTYDITKDVANPGDIQHLYPHYASDGTMTAVISTDQGLVLFYDGTKVNNLTTASEFVGSNTPCSAVFGGTKPSDNPLVVCSGLNQLGYFGPAY